MSPKGLTFVRCVVAVSATSLAVRSVALWVKGTLIGSFVYSHLISLLLPLFILASCMLFGLSVSLLQ